MPVTAFTSKNSPAATASSTCPGDGNSFHQRCEPGVTPRAGELYPRLHVRSECYTDALTFLGWGWSVFPLHDKRPAIRYWATRQGKRAPVSGWKGFQRRRPTEAVVTQMFDARNAGRINGLAVVTGAVSGGLCVRDFDHPAGYVAWAEANPDLARRCPTARTARGVHVYVRLPAGHRPVYRQWATGPDKGELLGDGLHYVVLPPSWHPDGTHYRWAVEPVGPESFPVITPAGAGFLPPEAEQAAAPAHYTSCVSPAQDSPPIPGELSEVEVVRLCLPTGPGERNACLFRLARKLHALPHLADADAGDLYHLVESWYETAEPVIRTKSLAVCYRDFRRQWAAVRTAAGPDGAFGAAMAAALAGPHPPAALGFPVGPDRKLAAVCVALQRYAGADPFYLSCRTAARLCGYGSFKTAARRLRAWVDGGLLELVERGRPGRASRTASSYRWNGGDSPPGGNSYHPGGSGPGGRDGEAEG